MAQDKMEFKQSVGCNVVRKRGVEEKLELKETIAFTKRSGNGSVVSSQEHVQEEKESSNCGLPES